MLKARAEKLDCSVSVITPENIEFEYALAGPFQRLPAFVFDVALRAALMAVLFILLMFLLGFLGMATGALFVGFYYIAFFLLSWFYGIYFESRFNGRTPGKMVFRLRVISVDGRPINAVQAALRNLLRLADMNVLISLQIFGPDAPPAFVIPTLAVGLVVMTLTRRMQRLGDLAAGTMVVSEHAKRSPWNLQPDDLRAFGLSELIPATYPISSSLAQTVGMYMENRRRLSPGRRLDVAKHVTVPLIQRFGMLPDTSPDLLMCAMYVKIFLSEEQQRQGLERMRQGGALNRPIARQTAVLGRQQESLMPGKFEVEPGPLTRSSNEFESAPNKSISRVSTETERLSEGESNHG